MDTQRDQAAVSERYALVDEGGAAGLMTLLILLIFAVCISASVLLTVPQAFEASASAAAPADALPGTTSREPTFHERYPVEAVVESVEWPTF